MKRIRFKRDAFSGLSDRKLAIPLGPEKKLSLCLKGRKLLASKFGLTYDKCLRTAMFLEKLKINNIAGYTPLFISLRRMFGVFNGKKILEVGSATGDFATMLQKMGAKMAVMDEVGVNEKAPVERYEGFFEEIGLTFRGRNLDAIISSWSIGEYHGNYKLILDGVFSSLKKGGFFIFSASESPRINRLQLEKSGFKILFFGEHLESHYSLPVFFGNSCLVICKKP